MRIKLDENRPSSVNRSERPTRVPIHGYRDVLDVKGQEPGWHYCWVNDYNVDKWLSGGYEHVNHEVTVGHTKINQGSQIGSKVSKPVGNGLIAYLMRCPEEIYQEELRSLEAEANAREAAMKQELNSGKDGQYGGITIQTRLGS